MNPASLVFQKPRVTASGSYQSKPRFSRGTGQSVPWIAILLLLLHWVTSSVLAYSIVSAVVLPENPSGQSDELFLRITIETPGTPALLSNPSEVVIDRDEVLVVMHPDSGMLGALGTLTTNVPLGKLRVGIYRYVVALVPPAFGSDWGTKSVEGTFNVVPQLHLLAIPSGMFLYWPNSAESYVVQSAESLGSTADWQDLTYTREDDGNYFSFQLQPAVRSKFFRLIRR